MALQIFGGGSGGGTGGGGGSAQTVVAKSSTYTAAPGDVILATGTFTITVPVLTATQRVTVKNVGTGVVTVVPTSGTIDGQTSLTLATQYSSRDIVGNGTNLYLDATHTPITTGVGNLFLPHIGGCAVYVFGHSYTTGAGAGSSVGYAQRVAKAQLVGNVFQGGVAGTSVRDTATSVLTVNYGGPNIKGIAIIDTGINEYSNFLDTSNWAGQRPLMNDAMRTLLRTLRASTVVDDSSGTYTGTWTSTASSFARGGNYRVTATQNDFVDITATVPTGGGAVTFVFQGRSVSQGQPASASGGADYSIKEGATVLATGTTGYAGANNTGSNVLPSSKTVTGLAAGAHTFRITKTDADADELRFDCVLVESATPLTILVIVDPQAPSKTLAQYQAWKSDLTAIAAEMATPAGSLVLIDPTPYLTIGTDFASDNLHPNDRGHDAILRAVYDALANLTYRQGQNSL